MHRPPLPPDNIPGTYFCSRPSRPQGHSTAGEIMSIKKSNHTIGIRACGIQAYSAVPQPTASIIGDRTPPPTCFHGMYMNTFIFHLYLIRYVDSTQSGFRADIRQRVSKPVVFATSKTTHLRKLLFNL
jgi:hypothetical protein